MEYQLYIYDILNDCCKVSLCENFQRQSSSTAIPLSNGP